MKTKNQGIFLVVCWLSMATVFSRSAFALAPRDIAPNFSLPSQQGASLSLNSFRGKVVYLDFWASWCGPCRHTLPWMKNLQAKFDSQGLQVLAVNLDKNQQDAEKALSAVGHSLTVLFDNEGNVARTFSLPTMPTSFIIDRDGVIVAVHPGFREGDDATIETEIQKALANK